MFGGAYFIAAVTVWVTEPLSNATTDGSASCSVSAVAFVSSLPDKSEIGRSPCGEVRSTIESDPLSAGGAATASEFEFAGSISRLSAL
jgi:hypothetical protein